MLINPISYPGNKSKLIKQIKEFIPTDENVFVDVFCGSGIVGVNSNKNTIICNDLSTHAIDLLKYFYEKNSDDIIAEIEKIIVEFELTYSRVKPKGTYTQVKYEGLSLYNKNGYNNLKESYNNEPTNEKLLVLLIYGFNHYIRFNKKGDFNVPVGKVDFSASIYSNLVNFTNGIKDKNIKFSNLDFRNDNLYKEKNAVYYFDPPYLITKAPYNVNWNDEDEKLLLKKLDELNEKGCKFILSNVLESNGKKNNILIEWSKKYNVNIMKRQYLNANYQKKNTSKAVEVLITNF